MAIIQINIGDHISRQAGYVTIPNGAYRNSARWARRKAFWITRNLPAADVYFKSLPNGRSLRELLHDNTIWVNYHPSMNAYGEAEISGKEIAISASAFRIGRWTVLATLVHELAHINGVPGGNTTAAERAVLACGMGRQSELTTGVDDPHTPYDPGIRG